MASVFTSKLSPYWIASIRFWVPDHSNPRGGRWKQTTQSTKILTSESKDVALAVAERFEESVREAPRSSNKKLFFESALLRILDAANVSMHKESSWKAFSAQWLSEQNGTESTKEKYKAGLDRLNAHLGDKATGSIREITHSDLDGWYKSMLEDGLAVATANQHFKVARWCLERAVLHELLEKNPAGLVKTKKEVSHGKKPFEPGEITKIMLHIEKKEKIKEWRVACLFGLYCGLRIHDAINRRREEISKVGKMLVITFTPQKKKGRGKPVTLPLVGELAKLKPGKGAITPQLSKLYNPSKVFARVLKDAGIKVKKIEASGDSGRDLSDKTFHSWRHTCNTMLAANGVDVRLRQLISDHESAAMNARYTHPDLQAMATAMAGLKI